LQQEETAHSIQELITIVENAFAEYDPVSLNKVWITYQQCMIETMRVAGCNRYKLQHMKKDSLIRQGTLPDSLHVPLELVARTRTIIDQEGI
jgi:hypothetical protein